MILNDAYGPGFDEALKAQLRIWGIERLTAVQTMAVQAGVANGISQLVCAPTSSGKTLVGEIAALAAIKNSKRCLYLVSHKALADQKYADFEMRIGSLSDAGLATVGLSTGDRDEGEHSPDVLVSTYEKALALVLSGQVDLGSAVVIADELQILADPTRGSSVETLCTILRQNGVAQIVALSATIGNAEDLADWLGCQLVVSKARDVALHQEIWADGAGHSVVFGSSERSACHTEIKLPSDVIAVVNTLIAMERAPVLVFTESRREATDLASKFCANQLRTADGIEIAKSLEYFSEPTESSQSLQDYAQKRVAFHSADLTPQERQVIERGFIDSKFKVCFATSTLAAGVNFPFQSVVFSKLTYEWGDRQNHLMPRAEYRNMSGRAGRLGMHERGYSLLLAKNKKELSHAQFLVLPENDEVRSQLVNLSMRRTILSLVCSGAINHQNGVENFFENTLLWHQIKEENPSNLKGLIGRARQGITWLCEQKLIFEEDDNLLPTSIGKSISQSGLLPSTAISFIEMLGNKHSELDANFDNYISGILHWICSSDEFKATKPSRFLAYPVPGNMVQSVSYLSSRPLLRPVNSTDRQANQCAHALTLFCLGEAERNIRFQTNIPSGALHRLSTDVAWVLDGLRRIASTPELGFSQTLTNQLSMLARRVQWGAPAEALDILRVAQSQQVPGFGRQRAKALLSQGIATFDDLLAFAQDQLASVVGNGTRAAALVKAVANFVGFKGDRFKKVHAELADTLGVSQLYGDCMDALGVEYEDAIRKFLGVETAWKIVVLDDGIQQNVPDLLIILDELEVLIECKTTTKKPPVIKKEDAFAVMQKALGYDASMRRVTLGKPGFDTHSKNKVKAAEEVSLVEHDVFMEGLLRVHAGAVSAKDFLKWVSTAGMVELDRLGGAPSYEVLRTMGAATDDGI